MHTLNTGATDARHNTVEWPTWALIFSVYGAWWLCLWHYQFLGSVVGVMLLALVGTMHMSLQHELLHGHPTRSVWFNGLLAYLPVTLLYPYPVYRESHMTHHNDENLTVPGADPESYFVTRKQWQQYCGLRRAYLTGRMTMLGRLLSGPAHSAVSLTIQMLRDIASLDTGRIAIWMIHLILVAVLLLAVEHYFSVPVWQYLIAAYMANAFAMIRSFFEHRPTADPDQRSIIMDCCPFFRTLFLNNNFHFVHHQYPKAPWYTLPDIYQQEKDSVLSRNGHFYTPGYSQWLIGHLLKPVDSPVHPFADE